MRQVSLAAGGVEAAMPQLLAALCGYLDWDAARQWTLEPDRQAMRVRCASNPNAVSTATVRSGAGLVGRVWQSGVLAAEQESVAFPILDSGEVIGVIELISDRARTPADDEVTMLANAGVEIGQFIRRSETTQALRRSEADHRAIYERSPIGIARISSGGELLEANPALLLMPEHDEQTMRAGAWPDLLRAYDQAAARQHKAPFLAGFTDGSSVQVRAATGSGK